jgi:hypothetical protein
MHSKEDSPLNKDNKRTKNMSVTETKSNFSSLEKQLAKDSLEEALKNVHGEIVRDIERNKHTFSQEIQKTLENFKENLKNHITQEVDNKIALHLEKNIETIHTQVTSSFKTMFSPVLERTENDMKRLHIQGEQTLNSWADMMKQYTGLWTRPFFLLFSAAILTGLRRFPLCSSYVLVKDQNKNMKLRKKTLDRYAKALQFSQESLLFYQEKEKERETKSNIHKGKKNNVINNKKK